MLGLRFIDEIQLDVWCGDKEIFASDMFIELKLFALNKINSEIIHDSHLAVGLYGSHYKPEEIKLKMTEVICAIKSCSLSKLRRVSFICPNLDLYKLAQNILWDLVEE